MMALVTVSVLAGCLTSSNPFYADSDVINDPRIIGAFECADTGLQVSIAAAVHPDRHYLVRISEGAGGISDYQATLFKLGDGEFIDLFPIAEKNLMKKYHEGYPTTSGSLNHYTHEWSSEDEDTAIPTAKLHLVIKVLISEEGLVCFPATNKFNSQPGLLAKTNDLKFHVNGDAVILDSETTKLRSLLKSYSGNNWTQLFQAQVIDAGGYKLMRKSIKP